jgi:hypothetical protein
MLWRKLGDYSGPSFPGDAGILELKNKDRHVERAFFLTAKVESGGGYGAYCAYDGTAVTAGLDQHIAVYPRALACEDWCAENDQGTFWKLLSQFMKFPELMKNIHRRFARCGWELFLDGVLRYTADRVVTIKEKKVKVIAGQTVHGALIRDELTPIDGKVPSMGAFWNHALSWARALREPFISPLTFQTQFDFGVAHLIGRTKAAKLDGILYRISMDEIRWELSEPLDLALCVFHSHSVNAPGIARRFLKYILEKASIESEQFPRKLMEEFASSAYGRWTQELPSGRWARTRKAAMETGLWDESLFRGSFAVMPAKFV